MNADTRLGFIDRIAGLLKYVHCCSPVGALVPQLPRTVLLLTMLVAFTAGSVAGALAAVAGGLVAMLAPMVCFAAGGVVGHEKPAADRPLGGAVMPEASDEA